MPERYSDDAEISAARAIELSASGEAWLLDVREDDEWEAGHAASAHHIPMAQIQHRHTELPEDAQVLVVCRSGGRSQMVTEALRRAGLPAVNVVGGMSAWQATGGAVIRDDGASGAVI